MDGNRKKSHFYEEINFLAVRTMMLLLQKNIILIKILLKWHVNSMGAKLYSQILSESLMKDHYWIVRKKDI